MLHRGRESTDGDGEPAVPMAWFYAEYIADELLRTGDLMPNPRAVGCGWGYSLLPPVRTRQPNDSAAHRIVT